MNDEWSLARDATAAVISIAFLVPHVFTNAGMTQFMHHPREFHWYHHCLRGTGVLPFVPRLARRRDGILGRHQGARAARDRSDRHLAGRGADILDEPHSPHPSATHADESHSEPDHVAPKP